MVQLRDFRNLLWYDHHPHAAVGCTKYVGLPWAQEAVDILPDGFSLSVVFVVGVSLAFVVHSMSSTKEQHVSYPLTSELAVDEREREGFNAGRRGRGHVVTLRQRNKGRNSWENGELETGLGAQLNRVMSVWYYTHAHCKWLMQTQARPKHALHDNSIMVIRVK